MGKCQPLFFARERKFLFFSGQLKPSDLTLFQWFYATKTAYVKACFSYTWVIKNYTGSFLLIGTNIYIWLSINLESLLYLSISKFFKYWINKQGKNSNHNLQSRKKQHIFSMYQRAKTLQTGCFATFGFSACQGNLSWIVQVLPDKFLRN